MRLVGKIALGTLVTLSVIGCQKKIGSGLQDASNEAVVETTAYPAVVEVILPGGNGLCSGTFVGPRAILTAAHCAKLGGTYQILSSFGRFQTTTREVFGSGAVNDPNDLALLILAQDTASTRYAQIVPIGSHVAVLDQVRLVGFGCDDVNTQSGMGQKRTGTNQVAQIDDYLDLDTPAGSVGILGPINRAGSCFGDSGGPLLRSNGDFLELVGVVHAGGQEGTEQLSEYIDLTRADNRDFLHRIDTQYTLHIFDVCAPDGTDCNYETASTHIFASILKLWHQLAAFVWNLFRL